MATATSDSVRSEAMDTGSKGKSVCCGWEAKLVAFCRTLPTVRKIRAHVLTARVAEGLLIYLSSADDFSQPTQCQCQMSS